MLISLIHLHCVSHRQPQSPHLVIQLEKTGCRGFCPVYKLSIYSDRTVHFEGIAHTGVTEANLQLDEKAYQMLLDSFKEERFVQLDSAYVKPVADFPFTYLSFSEESGTTLKKVSVRGNGPEEFERLVYLTEKIAYEQKWLSNKDTSVDSIREIIVELVPGSAPEELVSHFAEDNLIFIKKITPNQPYFLFSVTSEHPDDLLELIRKDHLVKSAQWNHKLKKRSN
ncbi:MAG: hypothetical protein KDC53_02665 [Saprospiraceae bacterium]|nr:hypothetical protein [Saprospiraceae bacterium]